MLFQRNFDPQTYWLDPVLRSRGSIGNVGINFEFAAFMVDAHLNQDELSDRIRNEVFPRLLEHYRPFVEAYPFLSEPNPVELDQFGEGGLYIHGEILCPEGIDADLLYGLLYEFLLSFESLFIHVAGHILLAFDSETTLPDEDLELSMNRFWLNNGRILYIRPLVFRPGEDILLEESLEFLQKNVRECVQYGSVFKKGQKTAYLSNALEGIVDVSEVRIPRGLASVYNRYPWLISTSFMAYYSDTFLRKDDEKEKEEISLHAWPSTSKETEFISLLVGLPDWIATFVAQQSDEPLALILVTGFDKLLGKSVKLVEEYDNLRQYPGPEPIDLSRKKLQNKLISRGRLDRVIPPKKFTFDEKEGGINDNLISDDQEKLMAQMTEFLKDEEKVRNLFEKEEQDEDGEDDQDERDKAAAYFKKEGVDIDEDDFFEFFLRNALKVEKKDLSSYVAGPSTSNIERKRVYNNDSDYTSDEAEFPASYKNVEDLEEEYDSDELDVRDSFANMRAS